MNKDIFGFTIDNNKPLKHNKHYNYYVMKNFNNLNKKGFDNHLGGIIYGNIRKYNKNKFVVKSKDIKYNNLFNNNIMLADGSLIVANSYNKSLQKRLKKYYYFGLYQ